MKKLLRAIKALSPTPAYMIKRSRTQSGVDGRIISYGDRSSYIAEQYKILRTNIYSLSPKNPLKTILITSAQSQEGKSVTSCNLAFSLSLDTEKKVLLLDCDLRKPFIHKLFGLSRKPGFTDFISGKVNLDQLISKPAVENLYVLPCGGLVDNPPEILSSSKIKTFLEEIKKHFDFIVIDTPPVLNVTDASILGALCDGVILLVRENVTQKSILEEAFNLLCDAQAKPKGCIITNATIPVYHYYYRYKYYYRYSYGKDKNK